jgi:hypothetical protein
MFMNVFDVADDHVVESEALKPVPDAVAVVPPKLAPVPLSFVMPAVVPKRSPPW